MKKKMKHTPGPWKYKRISNIRYSILNEIKAIHVCDVAPRWLDTDPADESRANAQLISAAPDLLEACKDAWQTIQALHGPEAWDIYKNNAPEMKRLKNAINKAEGE